MCKKRSLKKGKQIDKQGPLAEELLAKKVCLVTFNILWQPHCLLVRLDEHCLLVSLDETMKI